MLSLQTNASALSTMNSMGSTNKALTASMSKLGTGYRVNSAMDDAAGLQIATRLNAQSRGMQVAQKNTQNSISMLQTGEGAMSEINNMLLRMKDLATESANDTSSTDDRKALQAEFDALGSEISNILKNTSFAGTTLFSNEGKIGANGALKSSGALGKAEGINFQVGATASENISFGPGATGGSLASLMTKLDAVSKNIGDAGTGDLKVVKIADGTEVTLTDTTAEGKALAVLKTTWTGAADQVTKYANEEGFNEEYRKAQITMEQYFAANPANMLGGLDKAAGTEIAGGSSAMITTLNDAINAVGTFRSDLGAVANRLEHTYNNLGNMITNTDTAKGRIMDVDYASESSNMTKNQMLLQVSTSMLKQSNSLSQMVGSLVQ